VINGVVDRGVLALLRLFRRLHHFFSCGGGSSTNLCRAMPLEEGRKVGAEAEKGRSRGRGGGNNLARHATFFFLGGERER
jgi:hypothetical protein